MALRLGLLLALLALTLAACGGATTPTPTPSGTPAPSPSAAPTFDASLFLPLPEGLGPMQPGGGPSAVIEPQSAGGVPVDPSVGHPYELGHCGLLQPIDFDASLWDPIGGHNGVGGPLTEQQRGELLNSNTVRIFLLDPTHALLVTPGNGFVLLERHEGSREYGLCD